MSYKATTGLCRTLLSLQQCTSSSPPQVKAKGICLGTMEECRRVNHFRWHFKPLNITVRRTALWRPRWHHKPSTHTNSITHYYIPFSRIIYMPYTPHNAILVSTPTPCYHSLTPKPLHVSFNQPPDTPHQYKDMKNIPYCKAIGSLMYVMLGTRLDIMFAVTFLSQFML